MPFEPLTLTPRVPANWDIVTHIRLRPDARPDTGHALLRWEQLMMLADPDGIVALPIVLATIAPVRKLEVDREAAIKRDLRNWSNPRDHGNNSQDKGWLELGRLT